jgi:hypothetical protein
MSESEKSCDCVGKDHQLGCPALDTLFASMLKPKRTMKEVEQAQVEIRDEATDEVVRAES